MKNLFINILLLIIGVVSNAQIPKVSAGSIKQYKNFTSKYVTARNVDVWLPHGYSKKKKYGVLYMQDGQMLFDTAITWNHQAWEVDDMMGKLLNQKKIKDIIVVAIWNGGATRHIDYFPQKPYESLSQIQKDTITAQLQSAGRITATFLPISDNYLKFLVTELKPFVDKNFSTNTNKENTFIMGSSMGALISIYAICEYPNVFGGAACLSTHWPGVWTVENNPIPDAFFNYLKTHLPNKKNHTIYFDCGDQTLDAMYPPLQKKVDVLMQENGFTNTHWQTKYFTGENHSEQSWAKRLQIPFLFLLRKK